MDSTGEVKLIVERDLGITATISPRTQITTLILYDVGTLRIRVAMPTPDEQRSTIRFRVRALTESQGWLPACATVSQLGC